MFTLKYALLLGYVLNTTLKSSNQEKKHHPYQLPGKSGKQQQHNDIGSNQQMSNLTTLARIPQAPQGIFRSQVQVINRILAFTTPNKTPRKQENLNSKRQCPTEPGFVVFKSLTTKKETRISALEIKLSQRRGKAGTLKRFNWIAGKIKEIQTRGKVGSFQKRQPVGGKVKCF